MIEISVERDIKARDKKIEIKRITKSFFIHNLNLD